MKTTLKTVILLMLIPCPVQAAQVAPAKKTKAAGPNLLAVASPTNVVKHAREEVATPKIDLTKMPHRSHKKGAKIATLEPLQQTPKIQNTQAKLVLPQTPQEQAHSEKFEKLKKEWAGLEASLDFDYEITRNTFRNDNCRMCAHGYINGLYDESEQAQKMLEFYKTISPNSKLNMTDLKNDALHLVAKRREISELQLHPYYKYLITLTMYAAPLQVNKGSLGLKLCRKHGGKAKKAKQQAPTQEEQLTAPITITVDTA